MKNENEILTTLFWPQEKMNLTGNLSFSNSADFKTMTNVDISRTKTTLEVFYSTSALLSPEDKTFFVKLYMKKEGDNYVVDFKKSSPELKNEQDVEDTLNTIKNAVVKMNTKPMFFPTGVVEEKKLSNKI